MMPGMMIDHSNSILVLFAYQKNNQFITYLICVHKLTVPQYFSPAKIIRKVSIDFCTKKLLLPLKEIRVKAGSV